MTSGTEHFRLDHNRVFVELEFVRADGTRRKTLAFVDSGDPDFRLSVPLAKELHLDREEYPHVLFGGMPLKIDPAVSVYAQGAGSFFTGMDVEANLPATVLDQYDVALDYAARTLTLAPPGSLEHEGARVPCKVNVRTGLAGVQAGIAGIIIEPSGGKYAVIGIATQDGKKTVDRVVANDRLISVDGVPVTGRTMGTVLTLLHGQPGDRRNLGLGRGGKNFTVSARVKRF